MKKTVTYKTLQKFDNAATNYLINNEYFTPGTPKTETAPAKQGFFTKKEPTKLVANIKSIIKQWNKHLETFQELQQDIWIDNCSVDEKTKVILYNSKGGYQFTKEALKKVTTEIKELSNTEVEIHVRITEGELDLTEDEKEAFNGIVIPEFTPEED